MLRNFLIIVSVALGASGQLRAQAHATLQQRLLEAGTYEQIQELVENISSQAFIMSAIPSLLPVEPKAFHYTSAFGYRLHPIKGKLLFHGGIDLALPQGSAVYATAGGYVVDAGYNDGLGYYVRLRHGFGFHTVYGHLSEYHVLPGQYVWRQAVIGLSGSTGLSTGPHLHYAIQKNGRVIDPARFCYLMLEVSSRQGYQKRLQLRRWLVARRDSSIQQLIHLQANQGPLAGTSAKEPELAASHANQQ